MARALVAELEDADVDLTGIDIAVWPITGTGQSLLVLTIDDFATELAEDDTVGDRLTTTLLFSPLLDDQSITRLVVNFPGSDEEGTFVFTYSVTVEVLRVAQENGTEVADDDILFQLVREDGS